MQDTTEQMSLIERAAVAYKEAVAEADARAIAERSHAMSKRVGALEQYIQTDKADFGQPDEIVWQDDYPYARYGDLYFKHIPGEWSEYGRGETRWALGMRCEDCGKIVTVDRDVMGLPRLGQILAEGGERRYMTEHRNEYCSAHAPLVARLSRSAPEPTAAERLVSALLDVLREQGIE